MNYRNLLSNLFFYFIKKPNNLLVFKRYAAIFLLMIASICLSFNSTAQSAGTAPVNPPTGGFAVDGNLEANIAVPGIGDWLPGNAGAGGYVMNSSGTPLNAGTTFHLTDLYNSGSDNNFAGGKKFDQNPNVWTWVSNPVNGKEDINNALLHFSTDASGHTWLIFAADRMTNNGEAYIDFEFLQNTLTTTGGPTSGGFSSAGPNGGRTLNDFVLTLELTNGGSTANFFVNRWESVGAGFDYVDKTSSVPAGAVYAAVNTATVPVSFGAFGSSTYSVNTFVEGGVDLTALLGSFSSCTELGIKTLLIKTKESAAPTATIVDFVNPIQVALTLGVANAGADQSVCSQGSSTSFPLAGTAVAGPGDVVTSTEWSVQSGTATIDNINSLTTNAHVTSSPATLRLTVTTQKGCTVYDDIVLTVSAGLTVTNISTDATCKEANNGSIDITVTGGVSPFTYDWADLSGTSNPEDRTNLSPGMYSVVVTDKNSCQGSASATINEPTLLSCSVEKVSDVKCKGESNGSATVTGTGGNGDYTYLWDDNETTATATMLNAGKHTVTVTDLKGCTSTCDVTILEPDAVLSCSVEKVSDVKCKGESNGSATVTGAGGNGDYTYLWDDNETTATATMLNAGKHTVTVTDSKGCTSTCDVTILEPDAVLSCSVEKVSDVKCKGESDGSATVTGAGGNGDYTYLWDDNETTATATMLNTGKHTVTVTDSKGCTSTCDVAISEPDAVLSCSVEKVSDVKCKGENNGSATVTGAGGNGDYTYLWDDNETTATATMLNAGKHTVTVTDSKGCTSTCDVTILEPDAVLSCSVEKVSDVKCKGENNGSATVTGAGGNGDYTYLWDDNETTATATMLNAGSHTVTVTDSKGCTSTCDVTISEPDVLSCSTEKLSDADCNANSTGSAKVTPTGGNGGYTYLWDDKETTAIATMLSAGHHSVTVTDSKGCTTTCSVDINEPSGLNCSVEKKSDVKCKGESNGSATVTPTGGNGGYSYLWDDNETTATATMLNAGSHTVTVTDSKGCTSTCDVTISEPDAVLSCSVEKGLDVKCKGESNGSATVLPAGGNGGYSYLWDDNETTATAIMLNAGSHSVTVTDSKGCTSTCDVTIYEPSAGLSIICKKTDVSCYGGASGAIDVTVSGGTGPYTYDWSDLSGTDNPEDRTGLTAGTYTVVVTDAHGCTTQCETTISQPDEITTSTTVINATCNKNNGSIDLTAGGGTQPYTYLWSNGATTEDIQGLAEGMYTVTITDAHKCTVTANAQVSTTQPPICSITKPTAPLTCNSAGNKLCATVTGGIGNIQYRWKSDNTAWIITSGQGTNCITYTAGSSSASDAKFTLTVTDANGCKSTCSIKVSCGCSFVVNGVAKKTTGQCYKLTGTAFHTAGSVFSTAPVNLKKSFQVNASLYFGVNDSGGDGIAFVLQNEGPHYIGNYGAGIGYNRFDGSASCMPTDNPGPVPSFIVEFDTYQNGVIDCKNVGDPAGDHIGFMSHSNSYHTSKHALSAPVEFPANIEDGQYHDALFDWNATTQTMTVTFTVSSNPTVVKTYTYTGDIVKNLFKGNPYAYFGFTASNGSITPNEHRVCIRTSCAPDYYISQSAVVATTGNSTTVTDKLQTQENMVSVFPNPFNTHLSFNFKSPESGKASLELFDMVGKKLAVIYDGELKAQTPYSFDYTVPAAYRVPMMYKLTIRNNVYHGFLMPEK